jgi:hypothetical protein
MNARRKIVRPHTLWAFIAGGLLLSMAGCSGCSPWPGESLTDEELEKEKREQREALVANDLVGLPTDTQRAIVSAKPGHWLETVQRFKSNREDLQVMMVGSVYRGSDQVTLPSTNFQNEFTRKSILPKGQDKTLGLQFFVPVGLSTASGEAFSADSRGRLAFNTEILAVPMMSPIAGSEKRSAVNELRENEFQLAVVSPQALAYQYLSSADAVLWPTSEQQLFDTQVRSYEVSLVEPDEGQYGLPRSMLTMTAVAAIVWDDVPSSDLSADQQKAIIDWIHWGGVLVVSGPASWSRLIDSFLTPYLPVVSAESAELQTGDFADLSGTWLTVDLGQAPSVNPIEITGAPVAGLRWKLSKRGQWLPGTGQLIAESSVGRGRIVMTGFPLSDPRIYNWPYFSSFFSTGLLRRWPREYQLSQILDDEDFRIFWAPPFSSDNFDPRLHSNLRILSRDLATSSSNSTPDRDAATDVARDDVATDVAADIARDVARDVAAERQRRRQQRKPTRLRIVTSPGAGPVQGPGVTIGDSAVLPSMPFGLLPELNCPRDPPSSNCWPAT